MQLFFFNTVLLFSFIKAYSHQDKHAAASFWCSNWLPRQNQRLTCSVKWQRKITNHTAFFCFVGETKKSESPQVTLPNTASLWRFTLLSLTTRHCCEHMAAHWESSGLLLFAIQTWRRGSFSSDPHQKHTSLASNAGGSPSCPGSRRCYRAPN